MRPTLRNADWIPTLAGGTRQPIVSLIAIELQYTVKAPQERFRVFALTIRRVKEAHPGRIIPAPRPVVAGQRPKIAGLGSSAPRVKDRGRCLVHKELRRSLQVLGQPINDRAQVEGGHANPIRQGAAMDLDPGTGKDLALSIQRKMVRVFADQHMRHGALGRQATLDEKAS